MKEKVVFLAAAYADLEARRLRRRHVFWFIFLVVLGVSCFEMLQGGVFPSTVLLAPFFAAYLGAWGLREDNQGGGLDLLLLGGLGFRGLALVRASLAAVLVDGGVFPVLALGAFKGYFSLYGAVELLVVIALWAFVGACVGFLVRAELLLVLLFCTAMSEIYWFFQGCGLILRQPPTEPLGKAIGLLLHFLGPLPLSQSPWGRLVNPAWEGIRIAVVPALILGQEAVWRKRSVLVSRES